MIRFLIVALVLVAIAVYIWWERTEKSRKRQVFFSLYNKALAKAKDKDKLYGVSVSMLDIMDETDISPTPINVIFKTLETAGYVVIGSNTVKMTVEGVAYFKLKYLSEKMSDE